MTEHEPKCVPAEQVAIVTDSDLLEAVACHEAGHAVMRWASNGIDRSRDRKPLSNALADELRLPNSSLTRAVLQLAGT